MQLYRFLAAITFVSFPLVGYAGKLVVSLHREKPLSVFRDEEALDAEPQQGLPALGFPWVTSDC